MISMTIIQKMLGLQINILKQFLENFRYVIDYFILNLILTWSENCILTDIITQAAVPEQEGNPAGPAINAPTVATFKMPDTELYICASFNLR